MSKIISLISSKGGLGKSSLSVMISKSIANDKNTVLIVEVSEKPSTIDFICGIKMPSLYTLNDVLNYNSKPSDAIQRTYIDENIFILTSYNGVDNIDINHFKELIFGLSNFFDYIIIDFDLYKFINKLSDFCDTIISVIDSTYVCVDNLNKLTMNNDYDFFEKSKFILNKLDLNMFKKGHYKYVDDIIDDLEIPLLGIVPLDRPLLNGYNKNFVLSERMLNIIDCIKDRMNGNYRSLIIE